MTDIRTGIDSSGLVRKRRTSSAYNAILYDVDLIWKPAMLLWLLIASASGSMTKAKISEDKGSPCRVDLPNFNSDDFIPFTSTLALGEKYISLMSLLNPPPPIQIFP